MYRLFITLTNGNITPFRDQYVSQRHADAGIVCIEEKGGIDVYDADQKHVGKLSLKFIRGFDVCRVGHDGSMMPSILVKTF